MGTTTTNLGMYKPAAGEDGWDATVNANADKLDTLLATLYAVDSTLTLADLSAIIECRNPRLPSGVFGQTWNPWEGFPQSDNETWVSGTLYLSAIVLLKGDTITNMTYTSGGAAAVAPTHWWFALYNSSYSLLRQTADQTSTAWGSNTTKTLALSSSYVIPTSGKYFCGYMMTAGTMVKLQANAYSGLYGSDRSIFGRTGPSTTGLTTTAPATAATPSDFSYQTHWAYVT